MEDYTSSQKIVKINKRATFEEMIKKIKNLNLEIIAKLNEDNMSILNN